MFYFLSRFAAWLASPTFYVFVLMCVAVVVRRRTIKVCSVVAAVLLLLFFSSNYTYNAALNAYVPAQTLTLDSSRHYVYAFIPGGLSSFDANRNRVEYGDAVDRLVDCVGLLKAGVVDTIIISGDGAPNDNLPEFLNHVEKVFDVDAGRLLIEHDALNTYQNFEFTVAKYGANRLCGNTLVVNSAMFMRRSMLCAQLTGWTGCDFYSVDCNTSLLLKWERFIPQPGILNCWTHLLHELVGYVAYYVAYGAK